MRLRGNSTRGALIYLRSSAERRRAIVGQSSGVAGWAYSAAREIMVALLIMLPDNSGLPTWQLFSDRIKDMRNSDEARSAIGPLTCCSIRGDPIDCPRVYPLCPEHPWANVGLALANQRTQAVT